MKYLVFNNIQIPLTCITGFSYTKSANVQEASNLRCRFLGYNPLNVQLQMSFSRATCYEWLEGGEFTNVVQSIVAIKPEKASKPSQIVIDNDIILPQLEFMLSSTNATFISDRQGTLQQCDISWTLVATRVKKDENRINPLVGQDNTAILPKITLTVTDKSKVDPNTLNPISHTVECANDIAVSELMLSAEQGMISLLLGDTYTNVKRDAWLKTVQTSEDAYFTIEGYGKWYIQSSNESAGNWLSFNIHKLPSRWFRRVTKTFISKDKTFKLSDAFPDAIVKSKATFSYLKYDETPYELLYELQQTLGYEIGWKGDELYLYDVPDAISDASVIYNYVADEDTMTRPISKVIIRDGLEEYEYGDDTGDTYSIEAMCKVNHLAAINVYKHVRFNQNMIIMTIPYEKRISIGCLVGANIGNQVINCICTAYDINFLDNTMKIELHYINK